MSTILKPTELKKIADDIETVKMREALAKKREQDERERQFREEFMHREARPDAIERFNAFVKKAAEGGLNEVKVMQFPANYCTDGGRAINNYDPAWPETLQGFAKNAYVFFKQHLEKEGFKVRAQIVSYPEGNLGDVGIFVSW